MKKMIDLRSDTVTRPGSEMINFMMNAPVGDDVFGDDPSVIELESTAAEMFGMEAALFCPSGTMTNQIAVKVHTSPGDEIICDEGSHVYRYEGGGVASNSGCSVRLLNGDRGRIKAQQVVENINPDNEHYPRTSLVVLENTCNRGGGSVYDFSDIIEISKACRENNLSLHLDGARLFNAMTASGQRARDFGEQFNSISICLSKGLGAPVGSLLLGKKEFIRDARRVRKVMGGGMRQAGYLAAAGIYALKNNISRLEEDHLRATRVAAMLGNAPFIDEVVPPETNIIIFRIQDGLDEGIVLELFEKAGVRAVGFGPQQIRMVTHLDINDEDINRLPDAIKQVTQSIHL